MLHRSQHARIRLRTMNPVHSIPRLFACPIGIPSPKRDAQPRRSELHCAWLEDEANRPESHPPDPSAPSEDRFCRTMEDGLKVRMMLT